MSLNKYSRNFHKLEAKLEFWKNLFNGKAINAKFYKSNANDFHKIWGKCVKRKIFFM